MGRGARYRTYDDKPKVGPLASCRWTGERWAVALTDEGRRVVENHLRDYPQPASVLAAVSYPLFLRAYADWEEANQAASYGVVRAAAAYEPDRGVQFLTLATWYVRRAVQDTFDRRVGEPAEFIRGDAPCEDGNGQLWDLIPAEDDDGPTDLELADLRDALRQAIRLADLTKRERQQLQLAYGLDGRALSSVEIVAAGAGSSRQSVRQNIWRGLNKLKNRSRGFLEAALP